jgi:hypothetical protein
MRGATYALSPIALRVGFRKDRALGASIRAFLPASTHQVLSFLEDATMSTNFSAKVRLWGLALFVLGLALLGQQHIGGQEAATTRDNFHTKSGKIKRLTPEELDKQVEADFARECASRVKADEPPTESRPDKAVPSHRLSRDVMSAKSFAKSAAAKKDASEFQITLKDATIEQYKNRATLTTPYQVVMSRVHTVNEDGDMHVDRVVADPQCRQSA